MLFRELQWKVHSDGTYPAENRVRIDNDSQRVDDFTLGENYRLRVRAWNLDGPGAWHSVAGQSALVAFKADPPPLHTPTPADEQLAIGWDPPPFTGGTDITGYRIQYRADSSPTWLDHPHTSTATSATIGGLANGTTYLVQVAAANLVGVGDWSSIATAIVRTTPDPPGSLVADGVDRALELAWQEPSDDGGSPVSGYAVQYRPSTSQAWLDHPHTSTATSATVGGLTNGTTYYAQVAALNAAGTGGWSDPASSPVRAAPNPPRSLSAEGDVGLVKLTWDAPDDDGGSRVTGYSFRYRPVDTEAWSDHSHNSRSRRATIGDLTNGTTYEIEASALNDEGASDWSEPATGRPLSIAGQVRERVEQVATVYEAADPWLRDAVDVLDGGGAAGVHHRVRSHGPGPLSLLAGDRLPLRLLPGDVLREAGRRSIHGDPRTGACAHVRHQAQAGSGHRRRRLALHRQCLRIQQRRPARPRN